MDRGEELHSVGDEEFRRKVAEIPNYGSSLNRATTVRCLLVDNGVDLLKPCSAEEEGSCWLLDCIPACNKLLNAGALQITSNRDGGLEMRFIDSCFSEDADLFPAHFLRDWLLTHHRCFKEIRDIDLDECHLSPDVRQWHLPFCSQDVGYDWNTSEHLELFRSPGDFPAEVVADLKKITTLNLRCCDLNSSAACSVARLIEMSDALQEIDLSSNVIKDDGFVAIADALLQNRSVRKLIFAQNELTSTAILKIADVLTVNNTLEYVDIFEVDLSGPHCDLLFEEARYAGLFKKVSVTWTKDRLQELSAILRRDDHMATLLLEIGCDVPSSALGALFDALEVNKTVTDINFGPEGSMFEALTARLVQLLQATETIRWCQILLTLEKDNEGHLIKILNSLEHNKSVVEFTMYAEIITTPLAFSIGKLLEANDVLNSLNLCDYWSVDTEDIRTIARGLDCNYTLLRLHILGDFDFIEGMPEIWEALRRNQSLLYTASRFAAGESTEQVFQDAFRKVRRSKALVEEVATRTGKSEADAKHIVDAAWAGLNCSV